MNDNSREARRLFGLFRRFLTDEKGFPSSSLRDGFSRSAPNSNEILRFDLIAVDPGQGGIVAIFEFASDAESVDSPQARAELLRKQRSLGGVASMFLVGPSFHADKRFQICEVFTESEFNSVTDEAFPPYGKFSGGPHAGTSPQRRRNPKTLRKSFEAQFRALVEETKWSQTSRGILESNYSVLRQAAESGIAPQLDPMSVLLAILQHGAVELPDGVNLSAALLRASNINRAEVPKLITSRLRVQGRTTNLESYTLVTPSLRRVIEEAKEVAKLTSNDEFVAFRHLVAALLTAGFEPGSAAAQDLARSGTRLSSLVEAFREQIARDSTVRQSDRADSWTSILRKLERLHFSPEPVTSEDRKGEGSGRPVSVRAEDFGAKSEPSQSLTQAPREILLYAEPNGAQERRGLDELQQAFLDEDFAVGHVGLQKLLQIDEDIRELEEQRIFPLVILDTVRDAALMAPQLRDAISARRLLLVLVGDETVYAALREVHSLPAGIRCTSWALLGRLASTIAGYVLHEDETFQRDSWSDLAGVSDWASLGSDVGDGAGF